MNTCLCGNAVDQEGSLCPRCKALHILDLDASATAREIEKTYRMLVKVWHPDRFQGDPKLREAAEEKLKAINTAHAYLESLPAASRGPFRRSRAKPATPEPSAVAVQPTPHSRRGLIDPVLVSNIFLRCLILLAGLAIPVIVLFGLDSWLSSNSTTASFYGPYRSQVLFALRSSADSARQSLAQSLHRLIPGDAAATPAGVPHAAEGDSSSAVVASSQQTTPDPTSRIPMPYVTVGLTPAEVTTVMGPPLSTTGNALRYKNATFILRNGVVAGWKVDAALIPLRVKIWPSGRTDPRLTGFSLGSTKNEVIAVQGTPTLLAEDKLGYGASEVFFEGGRVIGWDDNHASQRLRILPRPH
jgi:hypothetical protein